MLVFKLGNLGWLGKSVKLILYQHRCRKRYWEASRAKWTLLFLFFVESLLIEKLFSINFFLLETHQLTRVTKFFEPNWPPTDKLIIIILIFCRKSFNLKIIRYNFFRLETHQLTRVTKFFEPNRPPTEKIGPDWSTPVHSNPFGRDLYLGRKWHFDFFIFCHILGWRFHGNKNAKIFRQVEFFLDLI